MTTETKPTPTPRAGNLAACSVCTAKPAVHTIWTRQRGYLAVCSDCAMGF